ncbi:uncharacterized protein LOC135137369 [Zophobas morio]|uniref:uncharacterized protein LOC135137369 n=1 Tax=Zophobas morio TaxID=2755281 RepID=UPI003083B698
MRDVEHHAQMRFAITSLFINKAGQSKFIYPIYPSKVRPVHLCHTYDVLSVVYLLGWGIFENPLFIVVQIFILVLHAVLTVFNTYFFIKEFSSEFLIHYVSAYLALVAVTINFATLLWKRSAVREFIEVSLPFVVGFRNAASKSKDRILRESKLANKFVKVHLVLVLITGAVLIPVGKERNLQFAVLLFENYYPLYVVEGIIMYFVLHTKFQIYILLDYIQEIVDDYEDKDDTELLELKEYQAVVKERLKEMVVKINMLIKMVNFGSDLTKHFIPPMATSGVLMGLSAMSFVYLGEFFGYWCYFQNIMWCFTAISGLIMYVYFGQQLENETESICDAVYGIRWLSFNTSNRKTILITLINVQNPLKLKFTGGIACNYELGMKIYRNLYSFAAVMARLGEVNQMK